MVIAVWRQILGGSGGWLEYLGAPVAGCQRGLAQRADQPGVLAGGRAGQPLVAVGVGAVFALELVGAAGGDLLVVEVAGDGVVAQAGGGGDQRPGQGGAVPGALDEDGSAGVCLDAELVGAVVHDRAVAQGAGGEVEPPGQGLGIGAVVAEPAGLVAAGGRGGQDPGAGAAGVFAGPGQRQADREVRQAGGAPGGRAVVAMVASSAQAIFRSGLPLSSSRSRWSPSRTYQPPSGSLAHSPVRLDGPRENSGTGVASRAGGAVGRRAFFVGQDGDAGFDQGVDERFQPAAGSLDLSRGHLPGAGGEVLLAQPPVLRQRRGVHDRADGAEAVADPAVGGQEGPVAADGAGDAEQPAGDGRHVLEQQPGDLGEEQRPVVQGQAHQRGQHRAHRQRAGPPGPPGERGLDDRGLAGAVDEPGGEGHRLVADAAACGGQGQAVAAHRVRSARQRARRAPLEELMPGTWRA